MKKAIIIILTALLVLTAFISCNQDNIDDQFAHYVTYNANGGKGIMEVQKIVGQVGYLRGNAFTYADHHFLGWNTKADGTGRDYADKMEVHLQEDITLYAQWEHDTARVIYNANGGEGIMEDQTIPTKTATALRENAFTRKSNVFLGWNTAQDGSGTDYSDKAEITITEDTTLYAQWTDKTVMVTFFPNGGTGKKSTQIVYAKLPTALNELTFSRADHEFVFWDTNPDGSGDSYGDKAVVVLTKDTNLYAQWVHDKATITFNANGGEGTMPVQSIDTKTPTALDPITFTYTDHHFLNWDTTAEGEGDAYGDGAKITLTQDVTLYAQWAHDTAKVTFNANGGEGEMADQVMDTNTPTELAAVEFTKADSSFLCWDTTPDGSGHSYGDKADISISEDTVLYAQWIHDTAVLSYDANGGEGEMASRVVDTLTTVELDPLAYSKVDHQFTGWNTKQDGSGESYGDQDEIILIEDTVLYAQWKHDTLTVTFKPNTGIGEPYTQEIDTNTEAPLLANTFFKSGFLFDHWNTRKDDTGTSYEDSQVVSLSEDIVLYAIWSLSPYTVLTEDITELVPGTIYQTDYKKAETVLENRLVVAGKGEVTIFLNYNTTLVAPEGIEVASGRKLVIDGQGTLVASASANNAAIGGTGIDGNAGTITLNGGTIKATGGTGAFAIGGGTNGSDGKLRIGETMGLYGGDNAESMEFIGFPTDLYDGERFTYMEASATDYVTVTFDKNGGRGTMQPQMLPVEVDYALNANKFTHKKLFFAGWNTAADGSGTSYMEKAVVNDITEDTTLYAQWIDVISLDDTYGGNEGKKLTGGLRYTISDDLTLPGRLYIDDTAGEVTLILPKGKTLTLSSGLNVVTGQSLVIEGEGTLIATGGVSQAGIGGYNLQNAGTITINGGVITATGGENGAGIGGGYYGTGAKVTITGGTVTATGGENGAGIGGGFYGTGGEVTITGGTVTANGGNSGGAGIGGGNIGSGGSVTISGGTVTANGGNDGGAGIGGGYKGSGESVTIEGGTVTAKGGTPANFGGVTYGIGAGEGGSSNGTLELDGVMMLISDDGKTWVPSEDDTRTRYMEAAIVIDSDTTVIGGGNIYTLDDVEVEVENRITVSGTATIHLVGNMRLIANEGINVAEGNTLILYGDNYSTLWAASLPDAAAIGGNQGESCGTIIIYGGIVQAQLGAEIEEPVKAIGAGPGGTSDGTLTLVKGHALWGDNIGGNTVIMGPVSSASESYTGERYAYMATMHVDMLESSSSTKDIQLVPGAYSIKDDLVTIEGRLVVDVAAMFILPDGKTLNAKRGIHVGTNDSLMIDKNGTDAEGTGVLLIDNVPDNYAGIGGNSCEEPGYRMIWIKGGTIDVTGGGNAAGIGGGYLSDGGYIEINGGTVIATGGLGGAGIGAGCEGSSHGTLTIADGVIMMVSTNNTDWSEYDGSTRTRYMKTETGK